MSGATPGIEPEQVERTQPSEYALRFAFGGVVTAITGLIASRWGPEVGGLFLAFPAILPASLTLMARHADKMDAGIGAAGAAVGALGMAAFAAVVWAWADAQPAWRVLALASVAWLAVAGAAWVAADWADLLPRRGHP